MGFFSDLDGQDAAFVLTALALTLFGIIGVISIFFSTANNPIVIYVLGQLAAILQGAGTYFVLTKKSNGSQDPAPEPTEVPTDGETPK